MGTLTVTGIDPAAGVLTAKDSATVDAERWLLDVLAPAAPIAFADGIRDSLAALLRGRSATERAACAKHCQDFAEAQLDPMQRHAGFKLAGDIRARGK